MSYKNTFNEIQNSQLKECFHEYKLQDEVDALKNSFGIGRESTTQEFVVRRRSAQQPKVIGVCRNNLLFINYEVL